jgi:hypothetical protein
MLEQIASGQITLNPTTIIQKIPEMNSATELSLVLKRKSAKNAESHKVNLKQTQITNH